MDLISKVLNTVRVDAPLLSQMRISDDVTIDMQQAPGTPLHYVVSGTADLLVNDEMFRLGEGDIALFPIWRPYYLRFGAGGEPFQIVDLIAERRLPLWSAGEGLDAPLSIEIGMRPFHTHILSGIVGFNPAETEALTAAFPRLILFRRDDRVLKPTFEAIFSLMQREIDNPSPGFAAVAARSLELICAQILREWLLRSDHPQGVARAIGHPNMRRALEAVHALPGERWSLQALATIAGQSRSAFAQNFLEVMGETPFAYLRRERLRQAAVMLRTGRKPIAEIVHQLGYSNRNAFVRAFNDAFGMTPSAYRRNNGRSIDPQNPS
jgi:AraC-like DNA-binding protein